MSDDERRWNIQDGPDGPVEGLLPYHYVEHWLRSKQASHLGAQGLLTAWCVEHPRYVHDRDPRGKVMASSSTPIHLDDGGFATVTVERIVQADRTRKKAVRITRLPPRALSEREARELAQQVLRLTGPEKCEFMWCERMVELCDLLGHDSLGHRWGATLYRDGVRTEADLLGYSDERLLSLSRFGVSSLNRVHERMDHCGRWAKLTEAQRRTLASHIYTGVRKWTDDEEQA